MAKERVHRFLAQATGSRFSRGTIAVGGLRIDLYPQLRATCEECLEDMEREIVQTLDIYFSTELLLDRLVGTGRLDESVLQMQALSGPLRGPAEFAATRGVTIHGYPWLKARKFWNRLLTRWLVRSFGAGRSSHHST